MPDGYTDSLPPISPTPVNITNLDSEVEEDLLDPPSQNPILNKKKIIDHAESIDDYDTVGANTAMSVDLSGSDLNLGFSSDGKSPKNVKFSTNISSHDSHKLPSEPQKSLHVAELYSDFVIEFYVLDRQGRRLQDARNPDRDPPPLCRLKDKCNLVATTKSGMNLHPDMNINVIDTEIEARLLNLGRPLPSQIALYGWTTWGRTPLQCAVADSTLSSVNVRSYVDRFLGDDALQRCPLEELINRNVRSADPSPSSRDGQTTPPTKSPKIIPTPSAQHAPYSPDDQFNTSSIPESGEPPSITTTTQDNEPDDDDVYVDGSSVLDFVSPQLTSLRKNGRSMTLRELVQMGYLEPVRSKRRTTLSEKISSSGRGEETESQGEDVIDNDDLPHSNIFAIEIMFDEMRTGLQRKMPDIRASAPHGEGSSVFAVTDDVPIDVRVDLINMLKVDLDDAYFEVDFDITFSWLTRMAPFEVDEKLYYETKQKNKDLRLNGVGNGYDSFSPAASFTPKSPDGRHDGLGIGGGGNEREAAAAKLHSKKLWRPNWKFTNRVNDDGDVTEKIYISERQKMSRGMRLPTKIVEAYWPYGNPTREEVAEVASESVRKFMSELAPKTKSFIQRKSSRPGNELSKYVSVQKLSGTQKGNGGGGGRVKALSVGETRSVAESFDLLTRRTGGIHAHASATRDGGGGTFDTPSNLANSTTNSGSDDGVEGVTEIVLKVSSRGLRFSLENQKLENFPFDTLSLPIFISFREPMGCYQASIARTLKDGDSKKSNLTEWIKADNDSEDDSENGSSAMENASSRRSPHVLMGRRISKHISSPITSLFDFGSSGSSRRRNKVVPSSSGSSPNSSKASHNRYTLSSALLANTSEDVMAVTSVAANSALNLFMRDKAGTQELLETAQKSLQEINENDSVAYPAFRPAIDFIPIPGRLRLRVSNDYVHSGVAEHRLRSYKWGIEDLYVQKSKKDKNHDSFMQINVRAESVHELTHRWASPLMSIRVHVHRKSNYVLQYIYLPLFLMTFVSLNTILVGYGMDLVSAFGDRCSITLTLLLTVVATELPEHLKEVAQVKDLKGWAFQFIVLIICKDIVATVVWWPTTYWHSQDIAVNDPWEHAHGIKRVERLRNNFYGGEDFPWWHRIWFVDGMCTVVFFAFWFRQLLVLCFWPRAKWLGQQTAAVVRFEAKPIDAHLLEPGSFLRHFIMERAANFLHDRWRAGYAQQCKKAFIAEQRDMTKLKAKVTKKTKKQVPPRLSPFPVAKGRPGINRRASAIWVNEQINKGHLEVPPRWKHESTYQNPPANGLTPPTTRHHGGDGAPGAWTNPMTGDRYVNIDQKLDKLPECAMIGNLSSADQVITMLEKTPHAPRTELAYQLHCQWIESQTDLSQDDIKPWSELPMPDKIKNMVIINAVLDMCALAHQVHTTVSALFNKDGDGQVSSDEFLGGDALKPLFHDNVRVPLRKGDIIRVRDLCRNSDAFRYAVVVGWQQKSHWNNVEPVKKRRPSLNLSIDARDGNKGEDGVEVKTDQVDDDDDDDDDDDMDSMEADVDEFQFYGTVFLVRILKKSERLEFTSGIVVPRPQLESHQSLLKKEEIHAIPETALCWKDIRCDEFVKSILAHSDWLFDSDGTCSVNDHRCVPIARLDGLK